jgi:predicted TPR repeat methyltransferase
MVARALSWVFVSVGRFKLRRARPKAWSPRLFMLPRDVGLFLQGARTDAQIARVQQDQGSRAAFEAAYADSADPWASASTHYRYQSVKYDKLIALLPQRRFANVLDLGCGLGLLSQKLAKLAENVVGMDLATSALHHARRRAAAFSNLEFTFGDILDLPRVLDRRFDLIVVADVLYYLSPLDEGVLQTVAARIADLLSPGGTCLLANHYFFSADAESRVSRRIHRAFSTCPRFATVSEHRRPFFLATLLSEQPVTAC